MLRIVFSLLALPSLMKSNIFLIFSSHFRAGWHLAWPQSLYLCPGCETCWPPQMSNVVQPSIKHHKAIISILTKPTKPTKPWPWRSGRARPEAQTSTNVTQSKIGLGLCNDSISCVSPCAFCICARRNLPNLQNGTPAWSCSHWLTKIH